MFQGRGTDNEDNLRYIGLTKTISYFRYLSLWVRGAAHFGFLGTVGILSQLANSYALSLCNTEPQQTLGIVGQFGTGQFGTRQFYTKIIKRTIWHQDNKSGQFGTRTIWHQDNLAPDNLAPGQFGTKHLI